MNLVDVSHFDELVLLISNMSDEKCKRILLSKAAEVYGYVGKAHIIALTNTTYPTLNAGEVDANDEEFISNNRIRREGGGRKPITEIYPGITDILKQIIDGNTYGDPCKELHWVDSTLSLRKISSIIEKEYSISVSYVKVSQLLKEI